MDVLETVLSKLEAGDYKSALDVVTNPDNEDAIKLQSMELISLTASNLTDDNAENKPELYSATETLLNRVAQKCSPPEVLYELMEKIRVTTSDDVFTSILKTIQVAVLRLPAKRARCLEWVLHTIIEYLDKIALPDVLNKDMDEKEEALLECEESFRRLLQLYITLLLFLEPIVKHVEEQRTGSVFFDANLTQKNALICFLLRLMGKLFPYLQLQRTEQPQKSLHRPVTKLPASKSYSIQVAEDMIGLLVTLVKDPLFMLPYGEKRNNCQAKWQENDSEENSHNDCFLCNETYLTEGFAMLFYVLLAEDLLPSNVPLLYEPTYIFEMGLYYVVGLMSSERPIVYYKGIRLAQALTKFLRGRKLTARDLDAQIHSTFCECYVRALERSGSVRNREVGIAVFKDYINTFDDEGRYTIVSHLLKKFEDDSVRSFAINTYKDLISASLRDKQQEEPLVEWYSGEILKNMLTKHICVLKHGVKTNLLDNVYSITSALSALWVLLKTDQANRSNIWDYYETLESLFLLQLRTALDLSRAHCKSEMQAAAEGHEAQAGLKNLPEITISALNGEQPPVLTKEKKIEICEGMILRMDMLDFHLARVNGEIDIMKRNMKNNVHRMETE